MLEGDEIMKRFAIGSFACPMLAAAATVLCACGDAHTFKLGPGSWGETQPLEDWNGTIIELIHETLPCDTGSAEGIRSIVGNHLEFEGLDVKGLKSECARDSEAAIAIDVQARSIIYDFANIESAGAFRPADFNGYVFRELTGAAPEVVGARLDHEVSTLDLGDDDVVFDGETIRVNFEGLAFDDTGFVKIDLVFAD